MIHIPYTVCVLCIHVIIQETKSHQWTLSAAYTAATHNGLASQIFSNPPKEQEFMAYFSLHIAMRPIWN